VAGSLKSRARLSNSFFKLFIKLFEAAVTYTWVCGKDVLNIHVCMYVYVGI
jgi:hypothetical protein